jgi:TatD DNase family protein
VIRILNPGIDLPSSDAAVKLAEDYAEVFAAVGVHPNDALSWTESSITDLRNLAQQAKVAAIGEIGLDYYWKKTPIDLQKQILWEQLMVAAEMGLPVVIHVRDANQDESQAMVDCLQILETWHDRLIEEGNMLANNPGVLHSFSGSQEHARRAVSLSFCIGMTGPVTFPKSLVMQSVAMSVPLEFLLIETDAPFLTPQPHRGQRNEPAYVRYVAEKIAQLRDYTYEELIAIMSDNASRLFNW